MCPVVPEIIQFDDVVRLINESDAILECNVRGRPAPNITFYKSSTLLVPENSNGQYSIALVSSDVEDTHISIMSLTVHAPFDGTESDIYVCDASNQYGRAQLSATLTIVTNPCENQNCSDAGQCMSIPGGFTCSCNAGRTGNACETEIIGKYFDIWTNTCMYHGVGMVILCIQFLANH